MFDYIKLHISRLLCWTTSLISFYTSNPFFGVFSKDRPVQSHSKAFALSHRGKWKSHSKAGNNIEHANYLITVFLHIVKQQFKFVTKFRRREKSVELSEFYFAVSFTVWSCAAQLSFESRYFTDGKNLIVLPRISTSVGPLGLSVIKTVFTLIFQLCIFCLWIFEGVSTGFAI